MTVSLVGVVAALALVLVGALDVARAITLAHQARGAADLAALAAASAVVGGAAAAEGCAAAARVVASNGARLTACRVGVDGSVSVGVTVTSAHPWSRSATGLARAGPV